MKVSLASPFLAAALAMLPACAHPPAPVLAPGKTPGQATGEAPAAAADPDRALARRLVRSVWGTGGKELYRLALAPTARNRVYRYTCGYQDHKAGRTCMFDVVGEVDAGTRQVTLEQEQCLECW
jgi:hypothetical protein